MEPWFTGKEEKGKKCLFAGDALSRTGAYGLFNTVHIYCILINYISLAIVVIEGKYTFAKFHTGLTPDTFILINLYFFNHYSHVHWFYIYLR